MVFLMQMVKLVPVMVLFRLYDHFKWVLPGPLELNHKLDYEL